MVTRTLSKSSPADRPPKTGDCTRVIASLAWERGRLTPTDIVGLRCRDVVDRIRGKEGTVVRLRVLPKGGFEAKMIDLTRRRFETQKLGSAVLKGDAAGRAGSGKIGYLYVPTIYTDLAARDAGQKDYRSTARDLQKILDSLRASDVDVAVLDLRDNPGGTLTESIEVAAHFVGEVTTVQVRDGQGRVESYAPQTKPPVWNRPLVVLTNKNSSGGAEIVAAAVQDYRRGIVVGDSVTYSNGTIGAQESLVKLLYGAPEQAARDQADRLGVARITTQKFYRVNGEGIQGRGVVADIGIPALTEGTQSQSEQPYSLSFDTVPAAKFAAAESAVSEAGVQKIAKASEQRRGPIGILPKVE